MASSGSRKGVLEWVCMLLPAAVVAVSVIVSYVSLQKDVAASRDRFSEQIHRIEAGGSALAVESAQKIVRLEEKFQAIDQRLKRIEDGQSEMIRLLTRPPREGP